ncbi:MAG: RNA methyltransferase [Planctomycetota bacterium]|nr:MAG: RNA methyltransferase [Planctomycetota bacterium]
MVYDQNLELAIDGVCNRWRGLKKKSMFGGIGYLLNGNMAFGIWQDHLVVRCGPKPYQECLEKDHTRVFDVTGRVMKGWVMVAPAGWAKTATLKAWMEIGRSFAKTLPPK